MKAKIENVEIRGCEVKENKKGEGYLLVHFEEATGASSELVDKEMDREKFYKRGTIGNLFIDIKTGKFTTIRIVDFKIEGGDKK